MPMYEYTCDACKHEFEHLHRTSTNLRKPPCPKCGSEKTSKRLSVFAAVASTGSNSASSESMPRGCGRCGGPGPCAFDD